MTDSRITRGGGSGGGRGGGVYFAEPPRIFTGSSIAACRTARDAHFSNAANATELARYQADQYRAILLKPTSGNYTTETYLTGQEGQAYNANNWVNRSSTTATDAVIDARIAPYGRATPSGQIADAQIPASIARDNEITRNFLLNVLGLTAQELNDLFTDAVVSGSGAARIITVTQADGSTITLAVPDTTGGGGGSADGRVASGVFAADGTTLTLTLTTGGTVSISVPSALRQAGLSQSQVQALIDAAVAEDVVLISSNTAIPTTADGDTYVHTGSSNITITLPRASGQGAVRDGYEQVISNQGSGDLTIDGLGADTINSAATLVIDEIHRTVRLQKVSNSAWITLSDTKDDTGTGGGITSDERARLLPAFPAEGSRNDRVPKFSGDVLGWEVDAAGTGGAIADGSLTPAKMDSDTAAKMKAFRARYGSANITQVSAALPALANHNTNDLIIVGRGGTTTVTFVDLDDPTTTLTTTVAGDILMLLSNRWTRVGNLFSGGIAAAAAKAIADANKATLDRMSVFEHYEIDPGGISGTDFPEFMALKCSRKIVNKTISQIAVSLGGQNVGNIVRNTSPVPPATDPAAPFNNGVPELSGGIINLVLNTAARTNLKNSVGVANRSPQFIGVNVTVTFTDGTSASDLLHFGTNNNAFRASGVGDAAIGDAAFSNPPSDLSDAEKLAARRAIGVRRFEATVGGSPATLPVGTHTVHALIEKTSGGSDLAAMPILVSNIKTTNENFYVRVGREADDGVHLTMRYNPTNRQLVYSSSPERQSDTHALTLKAEGEA